MSDINAGHAVVVLLNARYLRNWSTSNDTWHFITIIGYNDDAGTFDYTDTCAKTTTTGCGSLNDGGVNTDTQSDVYNASVTGGWDW